MMKKSVKNLLDDDGLSNLKYDIIKKKDFPLYSWMLVDLPKAPKPKKKNFWSQIQKKISEGVNYAAGGIATNLADQAVKIASKNEENELDQGDTIY